MRIGASQASGSRKRPRVSSSGLSDNELQDIKADCQKVPAVLPGTYYESQDVCKDFLRFQEEFLLFRDEIEQLKIRLRELEEDSRQTKAELAWLKSTDAAGSLETAVTRTESPTQSQHIRTRLGVYSKAEVDDLIYVGTLDTISKEELCNQWDISERFEEFENNFHGCIKSEVDAILELEKSHDTEQLAKELEEYFCDSDDVKEILDMTMRDIYTKDELDTRLYEIQQSCEGINRIETEDLILDARQDLGKDLAAEIKDARADLQEWAQGAVRSELSSVKTLVKTAVRSRLKRRRLSYMTPWRKFPRGRVMVLPRFLSTAAASHAPSTAESTQELPPL